jgi:hypothetical protein
MGEQVVTVPLLRSALSAICSRVGCSAQWTRENDDVADGAHITNRTAAIPRSHSKSTTRSADPLLPGGVPIVAATASTFPHRRRGKPTPRHPRSTPRIRSADAAPNAVTPLLTPVDTNGMVNRTREGHRRRGVPQGLVGAAEEQDQAQAVDDLPRDHRLPARGF